MNKNINPLTIHLATPFKMKDVTLHKIFKIFNKWKKIKEKVFEKEGKKCFLCGNSNSLFLHEVWNYIKIFKENSKENKWLAILEEIHHFCYECHSMVHGQFGEYMTENDCAKRFSEINNCDKNEYLYLINKRERISSGEWNILLSNEVNCILKELNITPLEIDFYLKQKYKEGLFEREKEEDLLLYYPKHHHYSKILMQNYLEDIKKKYEKGKIIEKQFLECKKLYEEHLLKDFN